MFVLKLTCIALFVIANPCKAFSLFFLILCRQVTDILKMCMKKFHAEKYFETDLHIFVNLSVFSRACFERCLIVHTL